VFAVQFGIGLVFGIIEGVIAGVASSVAQDRGGDAAQLAAAGVRLVVSLGRLCITTPITLITTAGLARMGLSVARGETPDLGAFSMALSKFFRVLLASILVGFAALVGTLFCIIPGILAAIALQFYMFVLMDTELGPLDAVQYAWSLAKDHMVNLGVFFLVLMGISLVVTCGTCGIGWIIVQPVLLTAQGLIYVHLSGRTQDYLPDPQLT
jgi:uncharacterized membrane protein